MTTFNNSSSIINLLVIKVQIPSSFLAPANKLQTYLIFSNIHDINNMAIQSKDDK